jgi:2-polyprenyl-6-methoxyphenol hydroxylase-like FAD-dependent oxidoreductase
MSLTTGQGVSQNLEDAQTLALLLSVTTIKCHAEEQHSSLILDAIECSLLLYYHIHHKQAERITATGEAFNKYMLNAKPLAVYARYYLLWALNKFPGISKNTPITSHLY